MIWYNNHTMVSDQVINLKYKNRVQCPSKTRLVEDKTVHCLLLKFRCVEKWMNSNCEKTQNVKMAQLQRLLQTWKNSLPKWRWTRKSCPWVLGCHGTIRHSHRIHHALAARARHGPTMWEHVPLVGVRHWRQGSLFRRTGTDVISFSQMNWMLELGHCRQEVGMWWC